MHIYLMIATQLFGLTWYTCLSNANHVFETAILLIGHIYLVIATQYVGLYLIYPFALR